MTPVKVALGGVGVPGRYDTLPLGSYQAEIEKAESVQTRNGSAAIKVDFVCVHEGFEGKRVSKYFSLKENALPFLKELLLCTGNWDADELEGELTFEPDELEDAVVGVIIEPNQYTSRNTGEVVNTTGVGRIMPAEDALGPDAVVAQPGVEPAGASTKAEDTSGDSLDGLFPGA